MGHLLKLLGLLPHGQFISGQVLADKLGVSRTSISAWVAKLDDLGVEINTIKGQGYKLVSPVHLLEKERVVGLLSVAAREAVSHLDVKGETESTNTDALSGIYSSSSWSVYATEFQSRGKGRRGRAWQSPFAQNLMFSMARKAQISTDMLYCASLLAGVAVATELQGHLGCKVGLKWPNDVYVDDQKLGGILCEMQGSPLDEPLLVIGTGLNVGYSPDTLDYPTCSLSGLGISDPDRTALLAGLIGRVIDMFSRDTPEAIAQALDHWRALDILKDRRVKVIKAGVESGGIAKGIDSKGQLLLLNDNGSTETLNGGEVSIRW